MRYDSLAVIPLGGQSELGQLLWVFTYGGEILLVDAGAAYPAEDLPGVDLLLPNTNFLEANQDRILALLLTNGHEEHCGGATYLLNHLRIPRILGTRFVSALVSQTLMNLNGSSDGNRVVPEVDTVETRYPYQIGPFEVEWIQVNDAIADASALRISTPEGTIVYTSSFKLDQTPVDRRLLDVGRLAQIGESGVMLLISDSAGVENAGYTPSEKAIVSNLQKHIASARGRVLVVLPGTNTHRLQILFDIASRTERKVAVLGDMLIRTAVAAAVTGNLIYDRKIEASLDEIDKLPDKKVLIVATGPEGDPMGVLMELSSGKNKDLDVKEGDTIIYSADIFPGRSRQMAVILDQLLTLGVKVIYGSREGVHVSNHASREELKFMLSITNPHVFAPMMGEGRHIMHHSQLAIDWGVPADYVFPLRNGEILEIHNGVPAVIGSIEAQAVLFNRDQGERVTSFSVNERKALSLEGIVTIGLVVSDKGEIICGPSIEAGGAGFLRSREWDELKGELYDVIREAIDRAHTNDETGERIEPEVAQIRACVRDATAKVLRARLLAKPAVQVMIHELATANSD